jgi:hypothetical protein
VIIDRAWICNWIYYTLWYTKIMTTVYSSVTQRLIFSLVIRGHTFNTTFLQFRPSSDCVRHGNLVNIH